MIDCVSGYCPVCHKGYSSNWEIDRCQYLHAHPPKLDHREDRLGCRLFWYPQDNGFVHLQVYHFKLGKTVLAEFL